MRTATKIMEDTFNGREMWASTIKKMICEAINEARREALEEAIKDTIGNVSRDKILNLIKEIK